MIISGINGKKNIIGSRLKDARISINITQEALSIKLQAMGVPITRSSISKIEKHIRFVTDYELLAISEALNVNCNWLLGTNK